MILDEHRLTHIDDQGRARMVDVGGKDETPREAVARSEVHMAPATLDLIRHGAAAKGDVLGVARVAGIMAAKRTGELIPLCHPITLTSVTVDFRLPSEGSGEGPSAPVHPGEAPAIIEIEACARTVGKTGVEMEALTAVSVAALTIYDMAKAVDRGMTIKNIRLVKKTGGKSGTYLRPGERTT